jgi:hypothetical protein
MKEFKAEKSHLYLGGIILRCPHTRQIAFTGKKLAAIKWCFRHNYWFDVKSV